ncbi:MAG: sulfate permease [Oceanicoccus sp.]
MITRIANYLPILVWSKHYSRDALASDSVAAIIVTIMLIPQSLAYALLAGLPPEVGLYATILPLITYAVFGTSRTLSVGPVAIASLMTAAALSQVAEQGSADYLAAAIILAMLSGLFLLLLGIMKLGFLANFLSHPVISGFITASAILIALSQMKHLLGVDAQGDNAISLLQSLYSSYGQVNMQTVVVGVSVLVFLYWAKVSGSHFLNRIGLGERTAQLATKAAPVIGVLATIGIVFGLSLDQQGVAIVGQIPSGLPSLRIPEFTTPMFEQLLAPAIFISIIGYVESVSVGKTLAAKRREKIDSNQELIGLGAANVAAAISGGFPVTGGFSRSVVNFDAGAVTQAASIYTAIGIAIASLVLTPILYFLPKATLAATIIIAIGALIDFSVLKHTWNYSKGDFLAVISTIIMTLLLGVESGVICGIIISLGLHLYRTSTPHIAEVGLVEGTEYFKNVKRFHVITDPHILSLRVDESLFFANASYLEDEIYSYLFNDDHIGHVILICSAVNEIDFSALETLKNINERLTDQGVNLHLSEVKGPVLDALNRVDFIDHLSGKVYISQFEAFTNISSMKL